MIESFDETEMHKSLLRETGSTPDALVCVEPASCELEHHGRARDVFIRVSLYL